MPCSFQVVITLAKGGKSHLRHFGSASISTDLGPTVLTNHGFETHSGGWTWAPKCNWRSSLVMFGNCSEACSSQGLRKAPRSARRALLVFTKTKTTLLCTSRSFSEACISGPIQRSCGPDPPLCRFQYLQGVQKWICMISVLLLVRKESKQLFEAYSHNRLHPAAPDLWRGFFLQLMHVIQISALPKGFWALLWSMYYSSYRALASPVQPHKCSYLPWMNCKCAQKHTQPSFMAALAKLFHREPQLPLLICLVFISTECDNHWARVM